MPQHTPAERARATQGLSPGIGRPQPTLGVGRRPIAPGAAPGLPGAARPTAIAPFRPQGNFALAGRVRVPRPAQRPGAPGQRPGVPGQAPGGLPGVAGGALARGATPQRPGPPGGPLGGLPSPTMLAGRQLGF